MSPRDATAVPHLTWHSYAPPTGYGIAAQEYVAALARDARCRLRWVIHDYGVSRHEVRRDDIGAVVDLNLVHMVPDRMPGLSSPRVPNLGYTVFETDRVPADWVAPLRRMDRVAVPCTWNQATFQEALGREVDCVPHLSEFCGEVPPTLVALAHGGLAGLPPIPESAFVFLTVATWEPRKNLEAVVRSYLDAFAGATDVLLVIKTSRQSHVPRGSIARGRESSRAALARLVAGRRDAPPILLVARDLEPSAMRHLYARADAYVTLTRGEGWGYGAFESAWFGKPVVATGYGGHLDYLPPDLALLVDHRLTGYRRAPWERAELADHRYADPDHDDAVAKLRWVYDNQAAASARGRGLAGFVRERFDEATVVAALRRFIDAGLAAQSLPLHVRHARAGRFVPNAADKHFHEVAGHYDHRFFVGELSPGERRLRLRALLRAFCQAVRPHAIFPVLMHGALIGWAWNRRLLPWDVDIDLCLELDDLVRLVALGPGVTYDRGRYLLDVNPRHVDRRTLNRGPRDTLEPNKIDARFIDRWTGLYLDITALAPGDDGTLVTKCPHRYAAHEIRPLVDTTFEGVALWVPSAVQAVLEREYGPGVLRDTRFGRHWFEGGRWRERPSALVRRFVRRSLGIIARRLARLVRHPAGDRAARYVASLWPWRR